MNGGCTMKIKSSATLRNDYGVISSLAHESHEPIYITKNGEGDIVVMSIEAYEDRERMLDLKAKLLEAEMSRLAGEPTYTIEEARSRIKEKYDSVKVQS
jgi:prevent-host-death family protein